MGFVLSRRDVYRLRLSLGARAAGIGGRGNRASKCKLALTIRFSSWSDDFQPGKAEAVTCFAIAVSYEPTDPKRVQEALSVFDLIAVLAT